jgi:uncharacterized protein YciI
MEWKMTRSLVAMIPFAVLSLTAFASGPSCPETMEGETKIAVTYIPTSRWDLFPKYADQHVRFLEKQMGVGNIQYAGPFLKDGRPFGGLTIYSVDDIATAEHLAKQDPVIAHGVAEVKAGLWLECSPKRRGR